MFWFMLTMSPIAELLVRVAERTRQFNLVLALYILAELANLKFASIPQDVCSKWFRGLRCW